MFENIMKIFRKVVKKEQQPTSNSKSTAKERLHLVLMQDRANVSADFLDLMKQEIIEVIKKYIEVDESAIDVRLTNKENEDGTNGAPALYANIPILNIKDEVRKNSKVQESENSKKNNNTEKKKEKSEEKDKPEENKKQQENIEESEKNIEENIAQEAENKEIKEDTDNKEENKNKEETENENSQENQVEKNN